MNKKQRTRATISWFIPAVLLALVAWWQLGSSTGGSGIAQAQVVPVPAAAGETPATTGETPVETPATPETPASQTGLLLSFPFYGNTPSLAWSPDGSRLAFNSAFRSARNRDEVAALSEALGLYLYEREGAAVRRLVPEQRYHPAWLGNERIASACSHYEICTEGLYLTGLDGASQHALDAGVYHTVAVDDHQVLFYSGYPEYTQWNRLDIQTSTRETELSAACSWEPPAEMFVDQCLQQVGEMRVLSDEAKGLWVQIGTEPPVLLDTHLPFVFTRRAYSCQQEHRGPVAPCLSPDGRQVAYVASAENGMELRVHGLPETQEALAAMHQGEFPVGSVIPEVWAPPGTAPEVPAPQGTAPEVPAPQGTAPAATE
ncbi:MAG: PD40 domain-containing protein [Bradymonadales bacterium]|nr:PD40 domain-containing protein [Bradymonadales bacterium]